MDRILVLLGIGWLAISSPPRTIAGAADLVTLVSFSGSNGANPYAGLMRASDGNFYGTTYQGGTNGFPFGLGTVFKLTPAGLLTTLVSFNTTNGARPYAGLAEAVDGNLYGTTWQGGISNSGTLFRISTNGVLTSLLSFTNGNGAKPSGRLVAGTDGFFYGTTQFGGDGQQGTVFRVATNGSLTTLVSFFETNGANPYAEVIQGADGHFYGTTVNGGPADVGTVFRMTTNGTLTMLVSFAGTNGANPYGGLVQSANGILYGTTAYGGDHGSGTIFQITTNGILFTLRSFTGGADGANPWASLLRGNDGFFYGTTILGGATTGVPRGTVFQLMTNGLFTSLIAFDFDTNGVSPYGGLVQDSSGFLYGTTYSQGVGLRGTVFRLSPGHPLLQSRLQPGKLFQLSWDAWLGQRYQVQSKTNLTQTQWSDLGNALTATNGTMAASDSTTFGLLRYYRVKLSVTP